VIDKKTKTIQQKKSVPLITEKRLQANRELLIGQKIKRLFPGHGDVIGTVKKYSVSNDAYYLTYADGHHEWIPFLDILGHLLRSWQRYEAKYIANELFHQVRLAALESEEVRNNPTRPKSTLYTEGHSDIFKVWDSPDGIFWKEDTDKVYYILEDKKKCWMKIKIKDIYPSW
jgi:hypothetical protein